MFNFQSSIIVNECFELIKSLYIFSADNGVIELAQANSHIKMHHHTILIYIIRICKQSLHPIFL